MSSLTINSPTINLGKINNECTSTVTLKMNATNWLSKKTKLYCQYGNNCTRRGNTCQKIHVVNIQADRKTRIPISESSIICTYEVCHDYDCIRLHIGQCCLKKSKEKDPSQLLNTYCVRGMNCTDINKCLKSHVYDVQAHRIASQPVSRFNTICRNEKRFGNCYTIGCIFLHNGQICSSTLINPSDRPNDETDESKSCILDSLHKTKQSNSNERTKNMDSEIDNNFNSSLYYCPNYLACIHRNTTCKKIHTNVENTKQHLNHASKFCIPCNYNTDCYKVDCPYLHSHQSCPGVSTSVCKTNQCNIINTKLHVHINNFRLHSSSEFCYNCKFETKSKKCLIENCKFKHIGQKCQCGKKCTHILHIQRAQNKKIRAKELRATKSQDKIIQSQNKNLNTKNSKCVRNQNISVPDNNHNVKKSDSDIDFLYKVNNNVPGEDIDSYFRFIDDICKLLTDNI